MHPFSVRFEVCENLDEGWLLFDEACYMLTPPLNWTAASDHCGAQGAELAVVSSSKQNAFITTSVCYCMDACWLGLSRRHRPLQTNKEEWDHSEWEWLLRDSSLDRGKKSRRALAMI